MDILIRIVLALVVSLGITATEARPAQAALEMDCEVPPSGVCPCGMPMPQRTPQPCATTSLPLSLPARRVAVVVAEAAPAEQVIREPRPWPWALTWVSDFGSGSSAEALPVATGPPLLASERNAHLGVFRI